ncbi:Beta,beta-carotene 15,15'-monooxygenase [Penaeus vannamei]|uniref:Beta,beta-carotene 15,15'-monooxygenase n=1 Tax=Penaeus vannamei TaxID=6689 RepID=A0A423SKM7_PENVA|nr:Beta,beta-carotene 15,15'-monooxygenase [Penaeus vannamei]
MGKYDYSVLCRHCDEETPDPVPCQLSANIGQRPASSSLRFPNMVLRQHVDVSLFPTRIDIPIPCRASHLHRSHCKGLHSLSFRTPPEWLKGRLVYNGPGLTKVGQNEYRHAFDASAILQKFEIEDGQVNYSSRFIRSKTYEQNQAAGAITRAEFGTPAPASKGMFSRFLDAMDPEKMFSDNALVSVVNIGPQHYAMCETPFMLQVNTQSLETEERINVNKKHGLMTQSPHPIIASDGVYTVGQGVGVTGPKYSILRYPLDGNLKQGKIVASVPARWRLSPAYMHSMAMTENYAILIEQPLAVSLSELLSDIVSNAPFIDGLKWHNEPVLIHVVDRQTWKHVKTRYVTDPFFFMHVANAYEEGDHIIMDIPTYKDATILHNMFISTLREQRGKNSPEFVESFRSELHRLVVPVNTKGKEKLITLQGTSCTANWSGQEIRLTSEKLTEFPIENPCINPNKMASKHKYLWAMGPSPDGGDSGFALSPLSPFLLPSSSSYSSLSFPVSPILFLLILLLSCVPHPLPTHPSPFLFLLHVMKLDVTSGETWKFSEEHIYCAAPVFISRPDAVEEDDGVILLQCIDSIDEKKAYLLILDAENMTELCRATVQSRATVPMPLHGHFVPSAKQ